MGPKTRREDSYQHNHKLHKKGAQRNSNQGMHFELPIGRNRFGRCFSPAPLPQRQATKASIYLSADGTEFMRVYATLGFVELADVELMVLDGAPVVRR